MSEHGRPRLSAKSGRVHVPEGRPPSLMLRFNGERHVVAVLHGGKEIAHLTPQQARREAMIYLEMAWLASHPGSCPRGILE